MRAHLEKVFLSFLLVYSQPGFAACTSPALDGNAIQNCSGGTCGEGTSLSALLTTTSANDIIVLTDVVIKNSAPTGTPPTVSSVTDTAGLTWATRGSRHTMTCLAGGCAGFIMAMDVHWAFSPGVLSSDNVTINWSSNASAAMIVQGFKNVGSSTAPFDANVSLPAFNSDLSNAFSQPSVTMATNRGGTIFTFCGSFNYAGGQCSNTPGTGFTFIGAAGGPIFDTASSSSTFYSQMSTPVTSFTATAGGGGTGTQNWGIIADSLVGTGTTCTGAVARPQVWINE